VAPGEEYKCATCGAFKHWTFAPHQDSCPAVMARKCDACRQAHGLRTTSWWRLRVLPELEDGLPLGAWRPQPGAMQGMWERSPDQAAVDAEAARRRIRIV